MTKLFVTIRNESVQKVSDLNISTFVDLAANVVHFSSYLFKVEEGVGIFDEGIVGIILNSEIGQVDHGAVSGSADSLFHSSPI